MYKHPRRHVDLNKYKGAKLEAYYGLPETVKYCSKCVISNQRPNSAIEYKNKLGDKKETIRFNADNVCDACLVKIQKDKIDWSLREKELIDLCNKFRRNDGRYDCIVPGSGGKDSAYTSHVLKFKYGMNPLTVTWAPHMYTDWGWKNFHNWIGSGFDNYLHTPNGRVHRLLTRLATENLFHPFQPFFFGQKALGPKLALLLDIPLVFYGENQAEYGNPVKTFESAIQDSSYYSFDKKEEIYLGGVSTTELKEVYQVKGSDLQPYLPVDNAQLAQKRVEFHYLGYYLHWHPQACYYYAVENTGFEACPERNPGTYSKYSSIDDKIDDYHYYTTHIKFGIGRATYDASQEIRSGDITREEGVALVNRFDGEYPARFEKDILDYMSIHPKEFGKVADLFEQPVMDRAYFDAMADAHRSPHLWKMEDGKWILRHKIS